MMVVFVYLLELVRSSPSQMSTPTVTRVGGEDHQYGTVPTANPWSPAEIIKRINGDPAICGFVEGNPSESIPGPDERSKP